MTPFDPPTPHFDANAFSPALRALSLVLSIAVLGAVVFQTAAAAAFA